jgi:thiol-disulfide isomerase/thioredoxin
MRRVLVAGALGLALVLLGACSGSSTPSFTPGRTHLRVDTPDLAALKKRTDVPDCPRTTAGVADAGLPAVTVSCLGGGRPVDLSRLRGPMVVNFWQAYCGPCRKEMPALAAYARSQSQVKVLGVDYLDVQPAAALELARTSKVGYPLVADPAGNLDGAGALPHIPGIPFTVFVDAQGQIAHVEAVPYTSEAEVAAAAQQYLGTAG